jgi:hypothetical protein
MQPLVLSHFAAVARWHTSTKDFPQHSTRTASQKLVRKQACEYSTCLVSTKSVAE